MSPLLESTDRYPHAQICKIVTLVAFSKKVIVEEEGENVLYFMQLEEIMTKREIRTQAFKTRSFRIKLEKMVNLQMRDRFSENANLIL